MTTFAYASHGGQQALPRIYPLQKGFRKKVLVSVGMYLLFLPVILGGGTIFLMTQSRSAPPLPPNFYEILAIAATGYLAFILIPLSILSAVLWRYRVTLHADRVEVRNLLSTRTMRYEAIAGYRFKQRTKFAWPKWILIAKNKGGKSFDILRDIEKDADFDRWLASYPNLDKVEYSQSYEALISDPKLGATDKDRQSRVKQGAGAVTALSVAGIFLAMTCFFTPAYFDLSGNLILHALYILSFAAIPLLAVILVLASPELYCITWSKNPAKPNLIMAYIFPSLALAYLAAREVNLIGWDFAYKVCAVAGIAAAVAVMKAWDKTRGALFILAVGAFFWGAAVTLYCDRMLDRSVPTKFVAAVTDGRWDSNRGIHRYFLTLGDWGPQNKSEEIAVSSALYDATRLGDRVCISLHRGALGMPWYTVARCKQE
jgi:hypothetical protein